MSKRNDCWGIEVGANAIKAVRLVRSGGKIQLAGYDHLRFSKVLTTPDLDVDEAIQVNLERFLSRHSVRGKTVMVSVPGHMAFARFAKLPPVEPKKIPDIVRFEAVQQIPFPIDQVEWDYQVFSREDSPDVEVGIFAITKERIRQYLANFKAVGMNIDGVTLSPLALYNAMVYDMSLTPDSEGVIFMDIGTTSTDVIIVEDGSIWLRTIPIGGNNFTDALVKSFKLSFLKADKLKRDAGTSKYARQIFQAMRPVFADLVQEMQKSMGFYQSMKRGANLTKLVGFGSTFRLPGLQKFLTQQLQMEVIRPDNFEKISVDGKKAADFSERTLNLGTAYGLALQGLELETVSANVLPRELIKQRIWKAKQPWMAASAAIVLVSTSLAAGKLWSVENAFSEGMDQSQPRVESVIRKATRMVDDWHAVVREVDQRQRIENLRRILDYRDVWPKLMHDVSEAMMAMEPQEALLTPNYMDQIAKIPRRERRFFYIDSIKTEYKFSWDSEAQDSQSGTPVARSFSFEEIWGARPDPATQEIDPETGMPINPGVPDPMMMQQQQQQQQADQSATTPPSFVITVEGTTSHKDNTRFISDTFIRWLQQNLVRQERPYKIVLKGTPLLDLKPVEANVVAAGGSAAGPAAGPVMPGGRGAGPMAPGMGARRPAQASGGGELAEFYPVRPLAEESQAGDWRFVIQWTVQLVRPEDARNQVEKVDDKKPTRKTRPGPRAAAPLNGLAAEEGT